MQTILYVNFIEIN